MHPACPQMAPSPGPVQGRRPQPRPGSERQLHPHQTVHLRLSLLVSDQRPGPPPILMPWQRAGGHGRGGRLVPMSVRTLAATCPGASSPCSHTAAAAPLGWAWPQGHLQ